LGYRLFIDDVVLTYNLWEEKMNISIIMKNTGFAPLYKKPELMLKIRSRETNEEYNYILKDDLRLLTGGQDANQTLTISETLSIKELKEDVYDIFFYIKDEDSDSYIELANEQEMQNSGYKIGEFQVKEY
jgi:hypothetical protein